MRNECNIVRDILPLYAEDMVSPDTAAFVGEHLKGCTTCRKEFDGLREPQKVHTKEEAVPLVSLKRKMFTQKLQIVAFTAIVVIALLVSAFAFLDAPEYFAYHEDLFELAENADGSVTITFDDNVTDYSCSLYLDPDAEIQPVESGKYYYHIEAWTSVWDRWFSSRSVMSTTIQPKDDLPFAVFYVSNNGQEDVCIYGSDKVDNGGVITLPRLVLAYYLVLACAAFAVLLAVWFVVRKKANVRIWIERIMLYPVAYVIGHLLIMGVNTNSYSMPRDFLMILFVSVLLYCGMLFAFSIYHIRKEIKEAGGK